MQLLQLNLSSLFWYVKATSETNEDKKEFIRLADAYPESYRVKLNKEEVNEQLYKIFKGEK